VDQHAVTANRFSAAGPTLGYLAQVDYALLAALRRLDLQDDFSLSIETLDDIVFHHAETDSATEKWQSKHSIDEHRALTDGSVAARVNPWPLQSRRTTPIPRRAAVELSGSTAQALIQQRRDTNNPERR